MDRGESARAIGYWLLAVSSWLFAASALSTIDYRLSTIDWRLSTFLLTTHDSRLTTQDSRPTTHDSPAHIKEAIRNQRPHGGGNDAEKKEDEERGFPGFMLAAIVCLGRR